MASSGIIQSVAACVVAVLLLILPFSPPAYSTDLPLVVNVQRSTTEATLMGIHFLDAQNGWAVGASGTVLKTTDGGKKWKKAVTGTRATLTSVFFVDRQKGWVTGSAGMLRRTLDGGDSWISKPLDTQQP